MKRKKLYFECKTGAAGDMLLAALYALLETEEKERLLAALNSLYEGIEVIPEIKKLGQTESVHMKVLIRGVEEDADRSDSEQGYKTGKKYLYTTYPQLLKAINQLPFDPAVIRYTSEIYQLIGQAESRVHGCEILQIHFQEIGSLDALVDVLGSALAISMLAPDVIESSPVCTGRGTVRCRGGILPVPAPATAEIILGMPVFESDFDGELLTPTGAAVLKYFTGKYQNETQMEVLRTGYGTGTRVFEQPTFVKAMIGYE